MPKLPVVSGSEVVRALERLGFTVARQSGSHIVMRRGGVGCVVPNHRELKTGTLSGVLKQAGISAGEFVSALHTYHCAPGGRAASGAPLSMNVGRQCKLAAIDPKL